MIFRTINFLWMNLTLYFSDTHNFSGEKSSRKSSIHSISHTICVVYVVHFSISRFFWVFGSCLPLYFNNGECVRMHFIVVIIADTLWILFISMVLTSMPATIYTHTHPHAHCTPFVHAWIRSILFGFVCVKCPVLCIVLAPNIWKILIKH